MATRTATSQRPTVMNGVITEVFKARGFAFVKDDAGEMRFAHVREFVDQLEFDFLRTGQRVEFTPVIESSGLRAVEVKCVK